MDTKRAHTVRNHHHRQHQCYVANEETFLTPEKWFEKEMATYASSSSGRMISRNVILSRILRRVTDKRERFFVRKYLSRWFDSWQQRRRSSGGIDDDDNAMLAYVRSIVRHVVAIVDVMMRKVLSRLAVATTVSSFNDITNTQNFLTRLVITHCFRRTTSKAHNARSRTIAMKYDRDRSFESKTSSLAHAVTKNAIRVPKTIVQRVDILKRASSWYRDENYDWSHIRMKYIDAFSQYDDITRSKSDDTSVCATVTWNVID